ncbi:MAG: sialate O-acetylesterase [Fuerstiella sp.]|nr:sialate O-acetylesterase [Fuerstiella sp.]
MKYWLLIFLLFTHTCAADVILPKIIGSGMVLQRDSEVSIWGWADAGEEVAVSTDWLDEASSVTTDADGNWQVRLQTVEAGGPHTITVSGINTITLDDILFGEVWIGSGQSNMEMPLVEVSDAYTGIRDAVREVEQATFPEIRLFQVGNFSSQEPLEDVESGIAMYGIPVAACTWQRCSPDTVPYIASTAYFFGRELYSELGVPIGVIDSSWGGTSAEAWTPAEGLKSLGYTEQLRQAKELPQKADEKIPTRLYNGMIHPLRRYTIKGVVWYQGEGNTSRAAKYRDLFSTMIQQWRRAFQSDFPFYFVQISPFSYEGVNAAYLREAQLETLSLPGTGMAVTMDIGNVTDIHPKNKQEVGRRLALWALAKNYSRPNVYSGPNFRSAMFQDGQARLRFDYADSGLMTSDGKAPGHFEIAGVDQHFHPATAVINGSELIISAEQVSEPKAVRYAFTSNAQPNLINGEGLPASSFRTDRW